MRAPIWMGVLLLAGCATSSQSGTAERDVRLGVEAAGAPGAITLVLQNRSRDEVGYNLCPSSLERRSGTDWTPVPTARVCTMELRILPPGSDARYVFELPQGITAGSYRARASVSRGDNGVGYWIESGVFQVSD